jgi:hypothetical protein
MFEDLRYWAQSLREIQKALEIRNVVLPPHFADAIDQPPRAFNIFPWFPTELLQANQTFLFPALTHLDLRHVELPSADSLDLSTVFNACSLRTLKLSYCSSLESFLSAIARCTPSLALTTLHMASFIPPRNEELVEFLKSFSGLMEFYMWQYTPFDQQLNRYNLQIFRALSENHQKTLRRFMSFYNLVNVRDTVIEPIIPSLLRSLDLEILCIEAPGTSNAEKVSPEGIRAMKCTDPPRFFACCRISGL